MAQFHWADYLVMAVMLLASMATGLFFACVNRKQGSVEEYLMAGRRMHVLPVAFSTFVTWMSGISFLGDPIEVYMYGAIYFLFVLGYVFSVGLAAPFAAKIHRLKVISLYEFLERRYSKGLRVINSVASILSLILWLGIATYAPALALSRASGIPVWASITLLGAVCTFYVSLGGMKAVIWADTVQMAIMVAGMLAVVIQGSLKVGGITEVFRIAGEGGRINFKQSVANFNPLSRASLWTYFFGGLFRIWLAYVGSQPIVQRYCTVPSPRDAKVVVLLTLPMFAVMSSLIAICGLVMYATYADCDPLLNGDIQRMDQLVPHLVIDLLGFLPGIPGLFLSAVFSASLSSMSSGMNAISALGLSDVVMPLHQHYTGRQLSPRLATTIAKIIAIVSGVAITGSAFMTSSLGKSIFALNALFGGAFLGPVAGVIVIALIFPNIRSLFVHIAYFVSLMTCIALGLAAQILPKRGPWEELPLSISGCSPELNITYFLSSVPTANSTPSVGSHVWMTSTTSYGMDEAPPFSFGDIYQLNIQLYGPLGFFLALLVALLLDAAHRLREKMMAPRPGYEQGYLSTHGHALVERQEATKVHGHPPDREENTYRD